MADSDVSQIVPRKAYLKHIFKPKTNEILDKGLVLWFPGPNSYTGEDCCELHIHGGIAVISALLNSLSELPNVRPAEPGEFTKRAFMNDKLDLTEVEGLADLIHAETEAQRKQALRQASGHLSKLYTNWREKIVKCSANLHAFIDFSEDDNIEPEVMDEVTAMVNKLVTEIRAHLSDKRRGERLRDGVKIAIIGQPNVGKSSLLNLLCQRPAAIVSPVPGTTRDVVEIHLDLNGYPVVICDTAGIRETTDIVETEGVRRAKLRAQEADLKLILLDSTHLLNYEDNVNNFSPTNFISETFKSVGCDDLSSVVLNSDSSNRNNDATNIECLFILNKIDLTKDNKQVHSDAIITQIQQYIDCCSISCVTQEGIDSCLELIANRVKKLCADPSDTSPSLTQARHRHHLEACLQALELYSAKDDIVLSGHQLQKAGRHIGKLTGKITSEEILDVIFRDFCIGK